MSKPKILVTGATGKTGVSTTLGLLEKGFRVRALVRKIDARAERLRAGGAEIVVGSLESYRDLEVAMKGVVRAYFCPPLEPGTLRRAALFVAAAQEAKLEAVVQLSQWVADAVHPAVHAAGTSRRSSPAGGEPSGGGSGRAIRPVWPAVGAGSQCAPIERGYRARDRGLPRQSRAAYRQGLSANGSAIAGAQWDSRSDGPGVEQARQISGRAAADVPQGGLVAWDIRVCRFAVVLVFAGLPGQRVRPRRADWGRRRNRRFGSRRLCFHCKAICDGVSGRGPRIDRRVARGFRPVGCLVGAKAERQPNRSAARRAAYRRLRAGEGIVRLDGDTRRAGTVVQRAC